jgi:hypothetical protein
MRAVGFNGESLCINRAGRWRLNKRVVMLCPTSPVRPISALLALAKTNRFLRETNHKKLRNPRREKWNAQ